MTKEGQGSMGNQLVKVDGREYFPIPCPACGELCPVGEQDGPVWTCPADLADTSPYRVWHDSDNEITEEMREKEGVFSNCWEDFGGSCFERMPLHSACYERGDY